jgi:rhodanese-related sulfurtransferase
MDEKHMEDGDRQLRDVPRIEPKEAHHAIQGPEEFIVIDARGEESWRESNEIIPGARRIAADRIEQHVGEIPREARVIAYCT